MTQSESIPSYCLVPKVVFALHSSSCMDHSFKKKSISVIYIRGDISKIKKQAVMVILKVVFKKKKNLGKSHVYKWFIIHKRNDETSCLDVLESGNVFKFA